MPSLPTDPTKIDKNPFADEAYLRRELERFSEFFDGIPKGADELHAGWNRFQKRHGDVAAMQMSLAIDTLTFLHDIHDRLRTSGHDGVCGLIILFHVALLELAERGQQQTGRGATKAVIRAVKQGLPVQDKRALLAGFRFSEPYPLGQERRERRHLHCWALKAAGKPVDTHCLSCRPPDDTDLDRFIGPLVEHLYAMRSSFVHRAAWVWFARIPLEVKGLPASSGTMVDGYFNQRNEIITYEVALLLDDLVKILRRCIWNRLAQ